MICTWLAFTMHSWKPFHCRMSCAPPVSSPVFGGRGSSIVEAQFTASTKPLSIHLSRRGKAKLFLLQPSVSRLLQPCLQVKWAHTHTVALSPFPFPTLASKELPSTGPL